MSHYWDNNKYYIDGREITRDEAIEYVMKKFGRTDADCLTEKNQYSKKQDQEKKPPKLFAPTHF